MATHTRQELVTQALYDLGVAYPGQAASDADSADVDKFVDGMLAQLSRRGVVYVGDVDAIEDEFFRPLALLLANEAKVEFGTPIPADDVLLAENRLRQMTYSRPTREVLQSEYY